MLYKTFNNYGDVLGPLVLTNLHESLQAQLAARPDLLAFVQLADKVHRAEKISSWTDWTDEERQAFDSGDYAAFSRLRGYTEDEIETFDRYLAVSQKLIDELGEDEICSIEFEIQQAVATIASEHVAEELNELSMIKMRVKPRPSGRGGCQRHFPATAPVALNTLNETP